jgi:hypothetical protein
MNYPFKRVITDISNYRFLKKTINKNVGTVEWEKFKLRADWIGRIYTVVNLPPEVIYSPDAPEQIRPAYVLEETRQLNEYLTKLNLQEIIMPELTPIPNSISYLVVYKPYFQRLSTRWFLYRISGITIAIWAQHKFGLFGWVWSLLKQLYEFVL